MKGKRLTIDVKTGKQTESEIDFTTRAPSVIPNGINMDKLKTVLKNKGIIADFSEVE